MTNPENAVGTNAAYNGRTSVNAFNDDLAIYNSGIMSGWECVPNSGLTVSLGGSGTNRDVAIAEDNTGNKTTINNISGAPIDVTLEGAPLSNSRIDAIVAYVDNPPQGSSTNVDNYEACGLIAVAGSPSTSPVAPNDSAIRTAITADGASGATAYYVVLATITIASGTTDIVENDITAGESIAIGGQNIPDNSITSNKIVAGAVSADKIDWTTLSGNYSTSEQKTGFKWIDGRDIFKKTINTGTLPDATSKNVPHGISNLAFVIEYEGSARANTGTQIPIPFVSSNEGYLVALNVTATDVVISTSVDRTAYTQSYVTIFYVKTS